MDEFFPSDEEIKAALQRERDRRMASLMYEVQEEIRYHERLRKEKECKNMYAEHYEV